MRYYQLGNSGLVVSELSMLQKMGWTLGAQLQVGY